MVSMVMVTILDRQRVVMTFVLVLWLPVGLGAIFLHCVSGQRSVLYLLFVFPVALPGHLVREYTKYIFPRPLVCPRTSFCPILQQHNVFLIPSSVSYFKFYILHRFVKRHYLCLEMFICITLICLTHTLSFEQCSFLATSPSLAS